MYLDFGTTHPNAAYQTLVQAVIPRPIAWVLSENPGTGYNLAPFSFFNVVSGNPPIVIVSVGMQSDGAHKDTLANIAARGQYVVHIAHQGIRAAMVESSRTLPPGDSELTHTGLSTVPFEGFAVPRLADARVALACERVEIKMVGADSHGLIFGEVKLVYLNDEIVTQDAKGRLKIDPAKLDPVSRLGGSEYSSLGEILNIPRPS